MGRRSLNHKVVASIVISDSCITRRMGVVLDGNGKIPKEIEKLMAKDVRARIRKQKLAIRNLEQINVKKTEKVENSEKSVILENQHNLWHELFPNPEEECPFVFFGDSQLLESPSFDEFDFY